MDGQNIGDFVVVPNDVGHCVKLATVAERNRGEVDFILDDMFGEVDDDGPGPTDAVLVAGGGAAVIAAVVATLPTAVMVAGITSIGIGSVLPARSLWRRFQDQRSHRKIAELVGTGQLLNVSHPVVRDLVDQHATVLTDASQLGPADGLRATGAAHRLVGEVADLLAGHRLEGASAVGYATMRLAAMRDIRRAIDVSASRQHGIEREARVSARQEVEQVAGRSALDDVNELLDDLDIEPGE